MECFPTEKGGIVVMFCDNTARHICLENLIDKYPRVTHVMKHREFYLVRQKKITPIKQGMKENLYTKGEISRLKNE